MQAEFTYLRILVTRYTDTLRFYRDVLRLPLAWGDETTGYCEFTTGAVRLALFEAEGMARVVGTSSLPLPSGCQDRAVIIFSVDSVDDASRDLASQGIPLVTQPQDRVEWGIRTAHLRDPDGNLIEINQKL